MKMVSELGESTSTASQNPSCSSDGSSSNDTGDFECNICLDLAQDPIVTLCGHLFCWPCLYRWLHHHSYSQECPVCKALIQEEKLVPLYGRGKKREDPRSKPLPDMRIPNRPTGQRPETAEPPNVNQYMPAGFDGMTGGGFAGGFVPAPTARLGNIALFTAFGGLFPSLFNIQVHSLQSATVYGTPSAGYPYPFPNIFHGGHGHGFAQTATRAPHGHDNLLKNLLFIIGLFVILAVICY